MPKQPRMPRQPGMGNVQQMMQQVQKMQQDMANAQEEARRFNHNYLGTEHQLLGLARDRDMVSAQILGNLGVKATVVRKAVGRRSRISASRLARVGGDRN